MSYYASAGDRYRDEVADALAAGAVFVDLHALDGDGGAEVHATFARRDGSLLAIRGPAAGSGLPSIVDLAGAAAWDEREAHDGHGIAFAGHEPLRPLLDHAAALEEWTVAVTGADVYQIAVGPIHAGVIESGHFRFHVVGERVLHLDARLFYKHRGLERLAEGRTLDDAMACVAQACMACSVSNAVAYALACEDLLGIDPAPFARPRTLLLELERLWSHLNDIAAICAGVGLALGVQLFAALVDRARRLNERVAGHRFLRGAVGLGRSDLELDAGGLQVLRDELLAIGEQARAGWRDLLFNASFQDRLPGIGLVAADEVRRLGACGPAARAAGVAVDVRSTSPSLDYAGFVPVLSGGRAGDVAARTEQRAAELWQCLDLLGGELSSQPLRPSATPPERAATGVAAGRVESPRGGTTCVVHAGDGLVRRLRLRTGSYANWPAVAHAATGELLPDFPLVNKSFELCYACADR